MPSPPLASGEPRKPQRKIVIRRSSDAAPPPIASQLTKQRSALVSSSQNNNNNNNSSGIVSTNRGNIYIPQESRPSLDRMIFSSIHFSAPTFVNNITNRILFPFLTSQKKRMAAIAAAAAASSGRNYSDANIIINNNNNNNNTNNNNIAGVDGNNSSSSSSSSILNTSEDYAMVANQLTTALENALAEIAAVQTSEEQSLQINEVRCRRVEIREKRQLATIRLGLEATSARLHEYENKVCNALAATAGIEQHLSQSNARVLRGRSVSQLLKHFKELTRMNHAELNAVLKNLSKARVEQRSIVTAQWEAGVVSPAEPLYFGGDGNINNNDNDNSENEDENYNNSNINISNNSNGKGRVGPRQLRRRNTTAIGEDNNNNNNIIRKDKMHRLETAAVAAGLDRTFVLRSYTETQVDWCQRLTLLRRELDGVVRNTSNIDLYVDWIRQELVADIFHLVDCFNELYKEHPDTAVHQAYGRAILKTLELISRLYTTITSSYDELLSIFYSRAINQMGVTLFSEYSPKPLPAQPPLVSSTSSSSTSSSSSFNTSTMQHYHTITEPDLHRTFNFLIARARRDVIIVETIFGTTNSARQQLLAKMTEGVVKPFVTQQLKLVEFFERDMVEAEAKLSPRSKRKAGPRVVDAIAYSHTMRARLFIFFNSYIQELRGVFDRGEVDFLNKYVDNIFTDRVAFAERRAELELLRRYHILLEEQYTRDLHPIPDEIFDLREAHMRKTKELIERFTEVATRTRGYTPAKESAACILDLIRESLNNMGRYLDEELRKTIESIRVDRENWRMKPKSEEELLRPSKLESQQCGLRMLLFAQSSLMSLNDAISSACIQLLQSDARLLRGIEEAKESAFESLDERAEILLNLCANAIIVRSLSILLHYQNRNDYMPKVAKGAEGEMLAQPCTRACTLFCLYITRQFEEAKEFIRLSNGQIPQKQTASQLASGATLEHVVAASQYTIPSSPLHHSSSAGVIGGNNNNNNNNNNGSPGSIISFDSLAEVSDAVRARARTMNMQQLLYGDGGPSSFVRTVGVCLYRGIVTHLKSFTVTDRGALIYKQDVTAYMEAMGPIIRTPGLGGAVVEVLFRLLKETASLLLMPWDHIKGVRDTGLLRLMSNEEKVQFIKMREDLKEGFRRIGQ